MIFGLIRKLVFGLVRKVVTLIVVIVALIYGVTHWDQVSGLYDKAKGIYDSTVKVQVSTADGDAKWSLSPSLKAQVDAWLEVNGLNRYGDPIDTVYAGGTPLFDEETGETVDRYTYILRKHPELQQLVR